MNTVHLTDAELVLARHALRAYINSFGHDESDTVAQIRAVIARLEKAEPEPEAPIVTD